MKIYFMRTKSARMYTIRTIFKYAGLNYIFIGLNKFKYQLE